MGLAGLLGSHPHLRQLQFCRDDNGKLDQDGQYENATGVAKVKFPQEARASLGCAVVETLLPVGNKIGVRCQPFFYTGKWMINVHEWKDLESSEIQRVKSDTSMPSVWVTGARSANDSTLYEGDVLVRVKGIGVKLASELTVHGLMHVRDLAAITDDTAAALVAQTPRLGHRRL